MKRALLLLLLIAGLAVPSRSEAGRLVPGSSGARYELGRLVGKGGFGHVYKAWTLSTGPRGGKIRGPSVAIKEYESLATQVDEDEAQKGITGLRSFSHAVDDGFDDVHGMNFLVFQWVPGRTLDRWARSTKASVPRLVGAVADAAEIVASMNARGWLHLDLKPSNVMIDRDGKVTVIDTGVAKRKGADGVFVTEDGEAGTRKFMAPEQGKKGGTLDDRTDVFALAGTLYRLITHQNPIADVTQPTRIATHLDLVRDEALRQILAKGLAQSPADRYASAAELSYALRAWRPEK
jgi:serine/threonine-protein kinase